MTQRKKSRHDLMSTSQHSGAVHMSQHDGAGRQSGKRPEQRSTVIGCAPRNSQPSRIRRRTDSAGAACTYILQPHASRGGHYLLQETCSQLRLASSPNAWSFCSLAAISASLWPSNSALLMALSLPSSPSMNASMRLCRCAGPCPPARRLRLSEAAAQLFEPTLSQDCMLCCLPIAWCFLFMKRPPMQKHGCYDPVAGLALLQN
jgi:hypothetical protein